VRGRIDPVLPVLDARSAMLPTVRRKPGFGETLVSLPDLAYLIVGADPLTRVFLVRPPGLEPGTSGLKVCLIRYRRVRLGPRRPIFRGFVILGSSGVQKILVRILVRFW
jgi:hypothetical protein